MIPLDKPAEDARIRRVVELWSTLQLLAAVADRTEHELPPRQRLTLQLLVARGPMRVSALARELGVSPPTMTGILDRLERRNLVERQPDQRDRRVIVVRATSAGIGLIGREAASLRTLSRAVRRLGSDERVEVERGLRLLLGAFSAEAAGESAPPERQERRR